MRAWADVAVLAKTKNLQGGFVAQSAAGLPFLLSEGMEAAFVPPVTDAPRRARATSVAPLDDHAAVVTFDAVGSIDVAEALVGCHVLVRRADLPADALEAQRADWAGWTVRDACAGALGSVVGIVELPGQELLEVDLGEGASGGAASAASGSGRTILIPLVDAFVVGVDEDERVIDVDVPSGLLDL